MRRNGKPILSKIQDVMGIKNGKYCSSDVSVVSLNNNNGIPLGGLVTYTNCPNRETFTIDFTEVENNGGIIDDCVLGGSVTLTNLSGYVVNYGETICPVVLPNIKQIQGCGFGGRNITVDFGDNVVTDGKVYSLSFIGASRPGCYTIIGDSLSTTQDTVSSLQEVPDCLSCTPTPTLTPTPPQIYPQIQSCNDGKTYSVISNVQISKGNPYYYTFESGTVPNGCYTAIGSTTDLPEDTLTSSSDLYIDCETCKNNNQ